MSGDKIALLRPMQADLEELEQFFTRCIHSVLIDEGLKDIEAFVTDEVSEKMKFVQSDLDSEGRTYFFLLAKKDQKIIGTIAYGPAGALINELSKGVYSTYGEIGSVFVHPDQHNRGIGSSMLNAMYLVLLGRGVKTFTLDSGYTKAKKIWTGKLGNPDIIVKDYWGEGYDHYIWCRSMDEVSIAF
ncbi:GNAT family N-acetyltransferase [Fusibacter ferrireducens]|uniref:GNAT family N-acetyltransferase n=1 Tax=Fusibacter ferrireducens TaxID=2785058 RepID=A0ABR9ZQZ8_9FIRM|nr:GNAT family N-acetyltransferase [Fusibacter ferrireducens]MBF4692370.1 GNAT family N-acetyltransferase [Fusibacter ferrireducens]